MAPSSNVMSYRTPSSAWTAATTDAENQIPVPPQSASTRAPIGYARGGDRPRLRERLLERLAPAPPLACMGTLPKQPWHCGVPYSSGRPRHPEWNDSPQNMAAMRSDVTAPAPQMMGPSAMPFLQL